MGGTYIRCLAVLAGAFDIVDTKIPAYRYAYASPIAYRVATGMDVRGYVHERDKQRFMVRGD